MLDDHLHRFRVSYYSLSVSSFLDNFSFYFFLCLLHVCVYVLITSITCISFFLPLPVFPSTFFLLLRQQSNNCLSIWYIHLFLHLFVSFWITLFFHLLVWKLNCIAVCPPKKFFFLRHHISDCCLALLSVTQVLYPFKDVPHIYLY